MSQLFSNIIFSLPSFVLLIVFLFLPYKKNILNKKNDIIYKCFHYDTLTYFFVLMFILLFIFEILSFFQTKDYSSLTYSIYLPFYFYFILFNLNIYYFNSYISINNQQIKYEDIYSVTFTDSKNNKKYCMNIKVKNGTFMYKIRKKDKDKFISIFSEKIPKIKILQKNLMKRKWK